MPTDLSQFKYNSGAVPPQSEVLRRVPPPPASLGEIPPLLKSNLLVVFTGFNPGAESGRTGHHYAHRSNRFWRFLHESGLTKEELLPEQDVELPDSYRYGFTDLVARCTAGITQLTKKERLEGAALLEQKLIKYKPKYVAFIGKGIWDTVCLFKGWKNANFQYGLQEHTFGTKVVVLPSSSGLVSISKEVQLVWWNKLRAIIEAEREKEANDLRPDPQNEKERQIMAASIQEENKFQTENNDKHTLKNKYVPSQSDATPLDPPAKRTKLPKETGSYS